MADETTKTMGDFHCETLEMSLSFSTEDIDQDSFLKAAGVEDRKEYTDSDGDFAMDLTFGAREESTDYHGHMRIRFFSDGNNRIRISYHDSKAEAIEDVQPPYIEDCMQWLGAFFKADTIRARISVTYTFDESFSPVVSLPFPLVSSEKVLAGSLVTGLSILLPKEQTESAIIQMTPEGGAMVFFTTLHDVELEKFDLLTELERLSASVDSLIRKQKK
jgi:hypothetical protein